MVTIRKYGNRRLYDTTSSRYVNLEDLASLIREGQEVRVVDARTDEDLTREVLLQIILEAQGGLDFLPVGLLRRIIRATGDQPANRMLRQQLATAFDLLHTQLDRVESQFSAMFPAFFRTPPAPGRPAAPEPPPAEASPEPPPTSAAPPPAPSAPPPGPPPSAGPGRAPAPEEDLAALRSRLEQLERRLRGGS